MLERSGTPATKSIAKFERKIKRFFGTLKTEETVATEGKRALR